MYLNMKKLLKIEKDLFYKLPPYLDSYSNLNIFNGVKDLLWALYINLDIKRYHGQKYNI